MDKHIDSLEAVPHLKKAHTEDTPRPPLGPSEKNSAGPIARKPPTREIASRYKSDITTRSKLNTSAPRRCPSPDASNRHATGASLPKRSQSPERRTPTTPSRSYQLSMRSSPSSRSTTPVRDSTVEMQHSSTRLWPPIRSLSSSFQEKSISTAVRDRMLVNASSDQTLKPAANVMTERKKTPLRRNSSDHLENSKPVDNRHVRLVDQKIWPGVASSNLSRSRDMGYKVTQSLSLSMPKGGVSPRRMPISVQKSRNEVVKKVSLDENARGKQDTSLGLNTSTPSSASKVMQSPPQARVSTPFASSSYRTMGASARPSVINYIVDARKGKKSAKHIDDVHQMRLLYNRVLQWRFVNAQALYALFNQKIRTENILHNVWNTTAELHAYVILKRKCVYNLRQDIKLDKILRNQMSYLEQWAAVDAEHSSSLSWSIESLRASTLRLPVTEGARADAYAVKHAIISAVDVMQMMGSSICNLISRAEGTKVLVSELSAVAAKERAMLDECRELLSSTATMQVEDASLRAQFMQLKRKDHGILKN